ncbi:hypothetical protein [Streptomyces sp. NPDC021356]
MPAEQPLPQPSTTRWLDSEDTVRSRWRAIAMERRRHLGTGQ